MTVTALDIEIVVAGRGCRRWHAIIIERLRYEGHRTVVRYAAAKAPWHAVFDLVMSFERRFLTRHSSDLAERTKIAATPQSANPALRIDMTGLEVSLGPVPTLSLVFDGQPTERGALDALVSGRLPRIEICLDGEVVGRAAPMVDNRTSIATGVEDVLARAITLTVATASRALCQSSIASPFAPPAEVAPVPATLGRYAKVLASRTIKEFWRRRNYRFAHWRTGYRLGPKDRWREVPEEGSRFFADPFPFSHEGHHYIFVEDFDHAKGKGVIAVSKLDESGNAGVARVVIEEPTHLSYPQVFEHAGDIWMIPENSAGREVVLYRAEQFPHRWSRHTVLIAEAEISDATLLQRDDLFWLFGTLRDGHGSTSDTLVVYHAPALTGPWTPHAANPVLIDRTAARPAGAFVERDGRTWLPVQDGTKGYGGGMGLSELLELSPTRIRLGPAMSFNPADDDSLRIHTFNRAGSLEVIDWIVDMPKRRTAVPAQETRYDANAQETATSPSRAAG